MTTERWEIVGALFDGALKIPQEERGAWLAQSGQTTDVLTEVSSLLLSHQGAQGGRFVQDKIEQAVVSFQQIAAGTVPGASAGPYRLIRELGSGGMGVVFLADRSDGHYASQVAVKFIRPGMDTEFIVARFRRERQTLARLAHPNIARLHDGGTTEAGLPYLVMEYIDGPPLTEYAREAKLTLPDRIHLFLQICSAVDYAHRNFVIHRDIKPGNILVNRQGEPKLVDFGICKLLQNDVFSGSETRAQMLTPDYASPEQISGGVTSPLSDIYSLGVVLYELISGTRPRSFDGLTMQEIQGAAGSRKIRPPSERTADKTAARLLKGDLDNIVLRALDVDPECRYQSAALLADDLKRYFAHEPVHAKPATPWYRLRKFLRRNAVPVTAVAAVVAALIASLSVALAEGRKASERVKQTQALATKLVFEVHDSIATLPGATKAREVILKTGLETLDTLAGSVEKDPIARINLARSYRRLGDVQGGGSGANLGNSAGARASYRKAAALLDADKPGPRNQGADTERLILSERIGSLEVANGEFQEAVETLKRAISLGNAASSIRDAEFRAALAGAYVKSAEAKRNLNDWTGAHDDASHGLLLGQTLQGSGMQSATSKMTLAEANAAMGIIESHLGRLNDAQVHFHQGASILEELVAQNPSNAYLKRELMLAYGHVADITGNPFGESLGDRAGALPQYQKAAAIGEALHEMDPADQRAAIDYGIVLSRVESVMSNASLEEKMKIQQESLRVLREAGRIDPKGVSPLIYQSSELQHLGDSLRAANRRAAALEAYREARNIAQALAATGTQTALILYIGASTRLARAEAEGGRREEALQLALDARNATNGRPSSSLVFLLPRSFAAMGFTYADLAKSSARLPSDKANAVIWLDRSVRAWQAAQKQMGFSTPHRREMQEAESTLEKLSRNVSK